MSMPNARRNFVVLTVLLVAALAVWVLPSNSEPVSAAYREGLPHASSQPASVTSKYFPGGPGFAAAPLPPFKFPMIALQLIDRQGRLFKNQLEIVPERDASKLDLFVRVWNHTDQHQSLAVFPFVDFRLISMQGDDRAAAPLALQLAANEYVEMPLQLNLAPYGAGLHELGFLVVRRPFASAVRDNVAASICCFFSRHNLVLGQAEVLRTMTASPVNGYSFGLRPALREPVLEASSRAGNTLAFAGSTTARSWKVIVLMDWRQMMLAPEQISQSSDRFSFGIRMPALPKGIHELAVLWITQPFVPLLDDFGKRSPEHVYEVVRTTYVSR